MGINTGSSWDRFNFELSTLQNFAESEDDSSILLTLWNQDFNETMSKIAADPSLTSSQRESVHAFLELAKELTSSSGDPADDRKKLNDFINAHQFKQISDSQVIPRSDSQAKEMQAKPDRRDGLKEKIKEGIRAVNKKLENQNEVQQVKKAVKKLSTTTKGKLEEAKDFVKEGQKTFTLMYKLKNQSLKDIVKDAKEVVPTASTPKRPRK